jgi:hypothetical protein
MPMDSVKWVNTGGSPLVVMPAEFARQWRGTETTYPATAEASSVWEAIRKHSDYGRACDAQAPVDTLTVGSGHCLVLSDQPLHTAFLPIEEGGLIVRWVHAERDADVLRAVPIVTQDLWAATRHRIHVGACGLLLFDSAYPGDELPSAYVGEATPWLRIVIPKGTYEVDTAEYAPDQSIHLVLHRFRRADPIGDEAL